MSGWWGWLDAAREAFAVPVGFERWFDVGLLVVIATVFFWKAAIMYRRTVAWDFLGRALAAFALSMGLLFGLAVVIGFFPVLGQHLWVRWVLRIPAAVAGLLLIYALSVYPWPPPPERPSLSRWVQKDGPFR
jgi:hypothetical protein